MIKLGSNKISKLYLGSNSIGKAYLGSSLIFSSGPNLPTYTATFNPSSYSGNTLTNPNNAYTDENSSTYANVRLMQSPTSVYLLFNTSSIPSNAIIKSVTCVAKAKITSTANVTTRTLCMYSGTTAKGDAQTLTTAEKKFTFSGESWTRNELSDARIRIYTTNTAGSPWVYFYGATLSVKYSVPIEI